MAYALPKPTPAQPAQKKPEPKASKEKPKTTTSTPYTLQQERITNILATEDSIRRLVQADLLLCLKSRNEFGRFKVYEGAEG
jgi:hypothetical protein